MENKFINTVFNKADFTLSENGAKTYTTTNSSLVDQFGKAGNYRGRSIADVFTDQAAIWDENPELALRFPFYLRMVTRKVKVNKEESEKPAEEEITVQPADQTMYVISDELNVRSGCSTSDQILGSMVNGQSVQVTGIVQKNGTDNGWVQIAFNGGSGYVSSAYLSDQAPAEDSAGKAPEGLTYTGAATTVYAMSGTAVTIYEASDGNWYDKSGTLFTWLTESKLTNAGGDSFTTTPTGGDSYFTGVTQTVYSLSGTPVTIRESTDGYWYTDSGVRMTWIDYEKLESEGGEAFTLHNLAGTGTDVSEIEGKIYCPYCGNYYEQGNEFRNHICPERDAALAPED